MLTKAETKDKKTEGMSHQAKRAIIMAAGKGERLRPLTLETPKPLIRVNGVRMIDSVILALHSQNIYEIYVVVGYKKEKFAELERQYPGLVLIENPYYESCNNVSSLFVAREHLEDVIILDADQIIQNKGVLYPFFERSSYCCFWQDQLTNEWLLNEKDGIVESCSRQGGKKGWQLQSISFWTSADGKKLKKDVEEIFVQKECKNLFWDDIALFIKPEHYSIGIREVSDGDIIEIDSYQELLEQDTSYVDQRKVEKVIQ